MFKLINGVKVEMTEQEENEFISNVEAINIKNEARSIESKLSNSISMAQCRTQLAREGLLSNVQIFVDSSNNEELQIAWEYATRLKRDNILFTQVATMLNKTEEQIDEMYLSSLEIDID